MRNMVNHAEALDWAANWFRRLALAIVIIVILGVIAQVLLSPTPNDLNSTFDPSSLQFLKLINILSIILGGALTAFLLNAGNIVCSFLADFARGLLLEKIKQERQAQ